VIGPYTVGKKAVKFGYKRYGVPGAIAAGVAVLVGYLAVRRILDSERNADASRGIGEESIETGINSVSDPGTPDGVIGGESGGGISVDIDADSDTDADDDQSSGADGEATDGPGESGQGSDERSDSPGGNEDRSELDDDN
jgi:hypothetical protein